MGLSAEELSAETLYPGDTIEYFSMARLGCLPAPRLRGTKRIRFVNAACNKWQAFVNGDPRGHREAKVLQVLRDEPEYPLRLESQEMLPITLMVRRKRDRHDDEIDPALAKWRKIRTFKLVVGEVKGKTRADRLNEGLKRSMASAIEAAKAAFAAQKGDSRKQSDDDDDDWQVEAEVKAATKPKKQLKAEPKADRFQQQKLSFATPAANRKQRERSSELASRKRASLDSMSRRPPPASPSSSLSDRRPRNEALLALKHKKPRPLSSPPRGRAPHDSPRRLTTGGGKRPLTESKYFASDQQRKPQKKMELIKFVNHLEEKKASHATTLNEYLALAQKQTNAIHDFTRPRTASALDEISSSRSNGATAARKSKQEREQQRAKLRRQNAGISSWVKREKKNAPSTPPGPAKRQSLDQPRSVPDRHKSPLKGSNLSFVMASSAGGSSSGSSQSSSQAAKREKVRSSRDADDDGDERHRKRKRSSDFSSPAQRPNKSSDQGDQQPSGKFMNSWVSRK